MKPTENDSIRNLLQSRMVPLTLVEFLPEVGSIKYKKFLVIKFKQLILDIIYIKMTNRFNCI